MIGSVFKNAAVGTNCILDEKELLYGFSFMKEYFEEKLKE
jgi:hypothetical protein